MVLISSKSALKIGRKIGFKAGVPGTCIKNLSVICLDFFPPPGPPPPNPGPLSRVFISSQIGGEGIPKYNFKTNYTLRFLIHVPGTPALNHIFRPMLRTDLDEINTIRILGIGATRLY